MRGKVYFEPNIVHKTACCSRIKLYPKSWQGTFPWIRSFSILHKMFIDIIYILFRLGFWLRPKPNLNNDLFHSNKKSILFRSHDKSRHRLFTVTLNTWQFCKLGKIRQYMSYGNLTSRLTFLSLTGIAIQLVEHHVSLDENNFSDLNKMLLMRWVVGLFNPSNLSTYTHFAMATQYTNKSTVY